MAWSSVILASRHAAVAVTNGTRRHLVQSQLGHCAHIHGQPVPKAFTDILKRFTSPEKVEEMKAMVLRKEAAAALAGISGCILGVWSLFRKTDSKETPPVSDNPKTPRPKMPVMQPVSFNPELHQVESSQPCVDCGDYVEPVIKSKINDDVQDSITATPCVLVTDEAKPMKDVLTADLVSNAVTPEVAADKPEEANSTSETEAVSTPIETPESTENMSSKRRRRYSKASARQESEEA